MNELIVLSDIHGNLSALRAVVKDFQTNYSPDALILLGDLIDYGMRSNEVISEIKKLERQYPVVVIYGVTTKSPLCVLKNICAAFPVTGEGQCWLITQKNYRLTVSPICKPEWKVAAGKS